MRWNIAAAREKFRRAPAKISKARTKIQAARRQAGTSAQRLAGFQGAA